MRRFLLPTALSAVALVALVATGLAARPTPIAETGFLAPLRVGMAISVTQKETQPAHLYLPTDEEAKAGGYWQVTAVGTDFVECKLGTNVWRLPAHAIGRISSTAKN